MIVYNKIAKDRYLPTGPELAQSAQLFDISGDKMKFLIIRIIKHISKIAGGTDFNIALAINIPALHIKLRVLHIAARTDQVIIPELAPCHIARPAFVNYYIARHLWFGTGRVNCFCPGLGNAGVVNDEFFKHNSAVTAGAV